VKAQQNLLGHVLCGVRVADPPADEVAETFVKAVEELVCRRRGGLYSHPQLAESRLSSQHSAFSAGSQQVCCAAGAQQAALGPVGSGVGLACVWSSIGAPGVWRFDEADENGREWMQTGPLVSSDTNKA